MPYKYKEELHQRERFAHSRRVTRNIPLWSLTCCSLSRAQRAPKHSLLIPQETGLWIQCIHWALAYFAKQFSSKHSTSQWKEETESRDRTHPCLDEHHSGQYEMLPQYSEVVRKINLAGPGSNPHPAMRLADWSWAITLQLNRVERYWLMKTNWCHGSHKRLSPAGKSSCLQCLPGKGGRNQSLTHKMLLASPL